MHPHFCRQLYDVGFGLPRRRFPQTFPCIVVFTSVLPPSLIVWPKKDSLRFTTDFSRYLVVFFPIRSNKLSLTWSDCFQDPGNRAIRQLQNKVLVCEEPPLLCIICIRRLCRKTDNGISCIIRSLSQLSDVSSGTTRSSLFYVAYPC